MEKLYKLKKRQSRCGEHVFYELVEDKSVRKTIAQGVGDGLEKLGGFVIGFMGIPQSDNNNETVEKAELFKWLFMLFLYSWWFVNMLTFDMFNEDLLSRTRFNSFLWACVLLGLTRMMKFMIDIRNYDLGSLILVVLVISNATGIN